MLLRCFCKHAGQDALHGDGRRVHNKTTKPVDTPNKNYRCTVCKHERPVKGNQ